MEKRSVRGLSLRGSMYSLNRSRLHRKKLPGKPVGRASSSVASSPDRETVIATSKTITATDALMQELRKRIYAEFCSLDQSIEATTSRYDHCSQQAFRFFTTTNTISPEAFHHKVVRLGLSASRALCMQLFRWIDQEDLGEINYVTFAQRVFLPPGRFNSDLPVSAEPTSSELHGSLSTSVAKSPERSTVSSAASPPEIKLARPSSASKSLRLSSPAPSPRNRPPASSTALSETVSPRQPNTPSGAVSGGEQLRHHHTITSLRSPRALNTNGIALIYEHMPLDEIERCISQKLEERTSKSTDRFRQAFRLFTKSEGITFAEFYHHLERLQIHLSSAKCRALFNRFDLDGNGTIELSEFTAAIFSKLEEESDVVMPSSDKHEHSSHGNAGFEVEAGSTLTTDQILARLRVKLEQHTSKETDRFRQAYKIFHKSSGISPLEFNFAMGKLGMKLTDKQMLELFALFDFDKSGDLDLNEFVQGVMLDDCPTKMWTSVRDRQWLEESRRALYSKAVQSVQSSWTIAEIEQMLRAKIEQRTSRSSDCFRQAFRIFKKVNGIKPDEFHAALETIGLALDRSQSDILFSRFDANGSGDIDLDEFIHGVLPPDYTGSQWVAAADEMHRIAEQQKKLEAKQRPDQYMTEIEMESWSLDEIERKIRDKIEQATSKSSDIFRQAFKIFKKSNHVTIDEFRERLLALGFRLTPAQCQGLFRRYDTNNSNDIDLQEFCMRILPPDYTGDGDHWSHSQNYHRTKHRERLEYVKRTRNGLLMLPQFDGSKRFTKGHYNVKTFSDLEDDAQSSLFSGADNDSNSSVGSEPVRPASPAVRTASRPPTPQTPRPAVATSFSIGSSILAEPPESRASVESLSSPSRWIGDVPRASPRKLRVASNDGSERCGPTADSIQQSSTRSPIAPSRSSPVRPAMSPRDAAKVSSPRRPTSSKGASTGHFIAEFEDEEIIDDDANETASSIDLVRAKRRERRWQHDEQVRRTQWDVDGGGSRHSSKRAESVAASSTMSTTSTSSKAVGTAKYTPQRSHTLLIKRFLQATKRSGAAANASTSPSSLRVASSGSPRSKPTR